MTPITSSFDRSEDPMSISPVFPEIYLNSMDDYDSDVIELAELPSSREGQRVRTPRPQLDFSEVYALENEDLAQKSLMSCH